MPGPWEKYQQQQNPYAITQPLAPAVQQQRDLSNQGQALQNTRTAIQTNIDQATAPADIASKNANARQNAAQAATAEANLETTGGANEGQAKSASFYTRASRANDLYNQRRYDFAKPGETPAGEPTLGRELLKDILPDSLVNSHTSPERQQAEALQRDFIASTLRYESGANIPQNEFELQKAIYFPAPGDDQKTIELKAQLRANAINGLRVASGPAAPLLDSNSGAHPQARGAQELHDQIQAAMSSGAVKSYRDLAGLVNAYNQANNTAFPPPPNNKETFNAIANALKGKPFGVTLPADRRVTAKVDEMKQNAGRDTAFKAGAKDAISLGGSDELQGAVNALGQSLRGEGSFGDLYGVNRDAQRIYDEYQQQTHPNFYMGGQLAGSLAIPAFGARTPMELARLGAGLGGAYGFNSANGDIGDRLTGAIEGAAAGGATGYVVPKALSLVPRNAPRNIPPLVDPQTGQLNQPLEAMTPGQRVVHAEEYGINLPADAAGGRTAAVIGKGLDIMPGSAGVMEDARRATESQIAAASDVAASRYGNARTMNEAGGELQRGANEYIDRSQAVTAKAYNAIPISDQAQATTANTVGTLRDLTSRFQSNPDLAEAFKDPKLGRYQTALENGQISWKDLKDFRSIIGEKIGEMRFGEGSSTSDLRALYAGLSEDMRNTAAAQGPKALHAFERANSLYRQQQQLVEGALARILGPDGQMSPERAATAVQAMTKGGKSTGDLRTLAQIRGATVKSGAWNEIAATLIRLGGQPANSAGRDFNPQTFVNWYADMSEPARALLFGGSNNELRKSLDGFVAVNQRLMKVNALRNTSNTAANLTAAGTVGSMAMSLANPLVGAKLLTVMGGNYAMAKAWTNPAFVRLMTGYTKAVASGNQAAVRSQIGRLAKLAATNPDLREPLIALQQRLLTNDNAPFGVAASGESNPDEEQRNQQPY